MTRFKNRVAAGRELLNKLTKFKEDMNTVVIGLPRGGMVTAWEIAKNLKLPLGFLIIKKIGAPGNPELAIGAVTASGDAYIDKNMCSELKVEPLYIENETAKKKEEAEIRNATYSKIYKSPELIGKTIILVDDGLATGITMAAAIKTAIKKGARKVVVAVPGGVCDSFGKFRKDADEIFCLTEDLELSSVGEYYEDFPQVEDSEVIKILENAKSNLSYK